MLLQGNLDKATDQGVGSRVLSRSSSGTRSFTFSWSALDSRASAPLLASSSTPFQDGGGPSALPRSAPQLQETRPWRPGRRIPPASGHGPLPETLVSCYPINMAQNFLLAFSRATPSGAASAEPVKRLARRVPQLSVEQERLYRGLEGNKAFSAQELAKGFAHAGHR